MGKIPSLRLLNIKSWGEGDHLILLCVVLYYRCKISATTGNLLDFVSVEKHGVIHRRDFEFWFLESSTPQNIARKKIQLYTVRRNLGAVAA